MFILQSVVYKRGQHAIHSAKITKPPYPTEYDQMENVNNMGKVMNNDLRFAVYGSRKPQIVNRKS